MNLTFRRFVFLFQPVSPDAKISLYISVCCFTRNVYISTFQQANSNVSIFEQIFSSIIMWIFVCFLPLLNWICVCFPFMSFRRSVQGWERLPVVSLFLCFYLTFPHYVFMYFNFSDGHCRCSYISADFLLLCFCPFSFESVSFIFSKISSRWRKGGERLPVVSLFLRLTLFLTPAASQHLPTLEKQKTFEKYFFDRAPLCLSIICALKYPSI